MIQLERLRKHNLNTGYTLYCQYLEHFHLNYDPEELYNLINSLVDFDWFHLLLANFDYHYVGFCTVINTFSSISLCLAYYLVDLFVCPGFRKKKHGTNILNALEKYAINNNVKKLFVNADRNSCEFYKKQGWGMFDYIYHFKEL